MIDSQKDKSIKVEGRKPKINTRVPVIFINILALEIMIVQGYRA